jgi:hypothetical protein
MSSTPWQGVLFFVLPDTGCKYNSNQSAGGSNNHLQFERRASNLARRSVAEKEHENGLSCIKKIRERG